MYEKALANVLHQERTSKIIHKHQDESSELVLSVKQLAKKMGICEKSAYKLTKQPGFPSFKAGGRVFVNGPEFRRWMDRQTAIYEAEKVS